VETLRLALVVMLLPLLGRATQNSARDWFIIVEAGENQRWLLYFSRKKAHPASLFLGGFSSKHG
jgi:hypothetical protein